MLDPRKFRFSSDSLLSQDFRKPKLRGIDLLMKTQHDICHYSAGSEDETNIGFVTDYLHLKNSHQLFVDWESAKSHAL